MAKTKKTRRGWPELQEVASLGVLPPIGERNVKRRLELQLGGVDGAGAWDPTPLGEMIALSIITLTVRASNHEHMTPTYAALEEDGLDRIINALQRAILREVRAVAAA